MRSIVIYDEYHQSDFKPSDLLKQYLQMRTMMKQYGALAARTKMKGLGKLAGLS